MLTQAAKKISAQRSRSSNVDVQNSLLRVSTPSEQLRVVIRRLVCVLIGAAGSFPGLAAPLFNAQCRTRLGRVFAREVALWAAQISNPIELHAVSR